MRTKALDYGILCTGRSSRARPSHIPSVPLRPQIPLFVRIPLGQGLRRNRAALSSLQRFRAGRKSGRTSLDLFRSELFPDCEIPGVQTSG